MNITFYTDILIFSFPAIGATPKIITKENGDHQKKGDYLLLEILMMILEKTVTGLLPFFFFFYVEPY